MGELGNLFRDAVVVMCVLCLRLIQRNQNKILRPINKVSGKEVTEFVGNMFLIYSKPNHFSDATGDKLDHNFICKVEKKHQSSKMCRRQTADFFKKRMPRIAGLIACEWVERSFDHGEGLLRFFFS